MAVLRGPGLRDPVLLIANPGARRAARLHRSALAAFHRSGVRCVSALTAAPGHGAEVAAAEARRYAAVFVLGGDGTAMEVLGALANSGVPVGILPGGTGNLVARALGVPSDIKRAVPALLAGAEADVDLGVIEGRRRFVFAAGVGVDARMIEKTPAAFKRRAGILAYLLYGTASALRRRDFRTWIDVDGDVVERRAAAVMIANFGTVLNRLLTLGPGIKQDDGLLDLCIFSPERTVDVARLGWRLFRADFRPDPGLFYRAGRRFHVTCEPPQPVQADGEMLGATPLVITVEPRAARLLLPDRR